MSLSIKESFRYLNFMDTMIDSLSSYIRNTSNAIKVVEKHLKSKANSEALDETLDVTEKRKYECQVEDIVFLIRQLIDQKLQLALAVEQAKKNLVLNWTENGVHLTLDSAVEYAKKNRDLAKQLKTLTNLKASETKRQGMGYLLNVEKNQTSYRYDIEASTTIDFNRNAVSELYKSLLNKADTVSTQIEAAMLSEVVEFTPIYDVHDSESDIVETYLKNKQAK